MVAVVLSNVTLTLFSVFVLPPGFPPAAVTVTVQTAALPLAVVAVIVAVPAFMPVTFPVWSTAATPGADVLQVTVSTGVTVASNCRLSPSLMVPAVLFSVIVTSAGFGTT